VVHEADWVSAHTFYQGDLNRVLLQVVVPLVGDLETGRLADRFFYLRYWDGGLHLRLRVLPSDQDRRADVENAIRGRFDQYFALHPSDSQVSQEQYAAHAKRLALLEGLHTYTEEIQPNNSLAFIGYRRELERYGDGESIEAVERHFAESSRIALDLLSAGIPADARATAATAMILLAWFSAGPQSLPPRKASWIRDHGPARTVHADRQRARVTELARRMRAISLVPAAELGSGTLARWARSVAELRDVLAEGNGSDVVSTGAAQSRPAVSEVLDACAHLFCNRLGVSLDEELTLRHIATQSASSLIKDWC
jgi:thiopeptide-type bacteriocin biosynthesis protein